MKSVQNFRLWLKCAAVAGLTLTGGIVDQTSAAEPAVARPPFWAEKGTFVYRVFTPDDPAMLAPTEEGLSITAHLLDDTVPQIMIFNGLVGHDHPGAFNWDGLWPYWDRVTFRAGNSWETLAGFMERTRRNSNAFCSFHVNLTDVNIGLRDYPESRAYFEKLVTAKVIYRREHNQASGRRDGEPYVPQEIDPYIESKNEMGEPNPVPIFALVDYKRFWESGVGKQMIDGFFTHLPYAPPLLYLDVLTLAGGNFSTGFPDGPLGGSEQTQKQGAQALVDYLRSKGTDTGTEGDRPFLGNRENGEPRAGYVWYHGRGFSNDDYSVISGGNKVSLTGHHVHGNPGAFAIAPIGCTAAGVQTVKAHYEALLAGKPGVKKLPGLETWHIAKRDTARQVDEFDVPGGNGDMFRGDWADAVNYFYLAAIQENYHMGKRNVRKRFDGTGTMHLGTYTLSDGKAPEVAVAIPEFAGKGKAIPYIMLEGPIATTATVATEGRYRMSISFVNASAESGLNIYVNGHHQRTFGGTDLKKSPLDWGEVELKAGENTIVFDAGQMRAAWSDGTVAEWSTPYLRKGFKAWNGDVVFAEDYDRMWPDTWSGQKKIYFFSWDGTGRTWKLPVEWRDLGSVTLHPLTPTGRGKGVALPVKDGAIAPELLPQVPYVLVP